ncbi:MAG: energy-coupling factor ABC transporter permease, partial [bacterium]
MQVMMHMADGLISVPVGLLFYVVMVLFVAFAIRKTQESSHRVALMAVMGAFVFAAQMINFTIPGTGSSGHICGGIMLCLALGEFPALLAIASVLVIQCLFFGDGGLLALGCNVFNMGIIPCCIVYPLVIKPLLKKMGLN